MRVTQPIECISSLCGLRQQMPREEAAQSIAAENPDMILESRGGMLVVVSEEAAGDHPWWPPSIYS